MHVHECIPQDDKAASRPAPQGDDGRFDLCVAMNGRNDWLDLECPGRRLKEGIKADTGEVSGLNMSAGRLSPGTISESSSNNLPPTEASK
jgi:hypothetical protein